MKDLNIRKWTCDKCNGEHDRDYNASLNILSEGIDELIRRTYKIKRVIEFA